MLRRLVKINTVSSVTKRSTNTSTLRPSRIPRSVIPKRHFLTTRAVFSEAKDQHEQTVDEVTNEKIMQAENEALENDLSPEEAEDETTPKKRIEIGGRKGPEPTRYGDWEKDGRISDF